MGEVAEMMLDGTLCQVCGVANDDIFNNEFFEPQGFPWTCDDCLEDEDDT